jgi:hypothetical protein
MRKTPRIFPTRMQLLTAASSVGPRRYFPAWIESDDRVSALTVGAGIVLPRVRDSLPLRRVFSAATRVTSPFDRKASDARRLR